MRSKHLHSLLVDAQSATLEVTRDEGRELAVIHPLALIYHTHALQTLEHALAPVQFAVLVTEDEHGGGIGLLEIVLQRIERAQSLRLTHHHHPSVGHHGISLSQLHHLSDGGVGTIDDIQIEIPLLGLEQGVVDLAQHFFLRVFHRKFSPFSQCLHRRA